MSHLYSLFSQVIARHVQANSRLVLGLSGGVDSRVLLELLAQYNTQTDNECLAVYVHHGLSTNADMWASQCQKWCDELTIPLFIERVTLNVGKGQSIEKLARDARYMALAKHIDSGGLLLTGQHSDDQVETFLLALKRGSGPKGLSSMAECMPFQNGFQIRPLLGATRQEIEQYAHQKKLEWVEDESNQDIRFDRNFIRHSITPSLIERWPSFHQSVQRSAALCAEQERLLDELLQPALDNMIEPDNGLSLPLLTTQSLLAQQRLIRMWFEHCGFLMPSRQHLDLIIDQVIGAQADANPQLQVVNGQVRRFNQCLYLVNQMEDVSGWTGDLVLNTPLQLPDGLGEISLSSMKSSTKPLTSKSQDRKSVSIFIRGDYKGELEVIFEPQGLSAHPESRSHSRKLKKLFQEYNIPSWLRRRTPIILNENKVVAVMGLFVDKLYQGQDCEVIWSKS
ncbi:tRNA lysidine(34) synthetase TilS [Vibrio kyushuensis]|uniref:tRNA lysidine(34) synthetase TilS n=1 Tax=Vibrio kyushuensis TaxID=2910249 RepID=UPI003D0BF8C0